MTVAQIRDGIVKWWTDERRGAIVVIVMGSTYTLLFIALVYAVSNASTVSTLRVENARISTELDGMTSRHRLLQVSVIDRMDRLERTLFGEVLSKLDEQEAKHSKDNKPAPQINLDRWIMNNYRSLNNRIIRLEEYRFKTER